MWSNWEQRVWALKTLKHRYWHPHPRPKPLHTKYSGPAVKMSKRVCVFSPVLGNNSWVSAVPMATLNNSCHILEACYSCVVQGNTDIEARFNYTSIKFKNMIKTSKICIWVFLRSLFSLSTNSSCFYVKFSEAFVSILHFLVVRLVRVCCYETSLTSNHIYITAFSCVT